MYSDRGLDLQPATCNLQPATGNPDMCPDWESTSNPLFCGTTPNQLSHTSQGVNIFLREITFILILGIFANNHFTSWGFNILYNLFIKKNIYVNSSWPILYFSVKSGVSNLFSPGAISALRVAFKRLNAILGLYKGNYSLTVKREPHAAAG